MHEGKRMTTFKPKRVLLTCRVCDASPVGLVEHFYQGEENDATGSPGVQLSASFA